MTKPLLLFDIDGTLLHAHGLGMRAMRHVAAGMFGEPFSWEGVSSGGNLDPLILDQALAINGHAASAEQRREFRSRYITRLRHELAGSDRPVRVMPGVHDCLATLRRRVREKDDVVLGLLTGNYSEAAPIKLAAVNIDAGWFSLTAYGEEAPTRPALAALAARKYERAHGHAPHPKRVLVIGDTPRDVECAHANGFVAVGVATGFHSVEELRAAGADVVLPDLADATPLWRLMEG